MYFGLWPHFAHTPGLYSPDRRSSIGVSISRATRSAMLAHTSRLPCIVERTVRKSKRSARASWLLKLFDVTDPCLQHAIKKLLVAGGRGQKDISKDIQEAIVTLTRWQQMQEEEKA